MGGAFRFIKTLIKEISGDDLSGAAAELAYRLFLAMFPFFIFLAALGGFAADILGVTNPTEEIMRELNDRLPPDAASVLRDELDQVINSRSAGLVSFGIIASLWAASSGVGTLTKAMNRTYKVQETRQFWKRYAMSVGVTLLGGATLIAAFVVLVAGQLYGQDLANELGFGGSAAVVFTYARIPIILITLLATTAFLYWALPNAHLPFKWISPGAVLFSITWLVFTFLFGFYVSNFGSYNATYGTLGGIVALLVWLYLSGFIFLVGAEINAVLVKQEAPELLPDESAAKRPKGTGQARESAVEQTKQTILLTGITLAVLTLLRAVGRLFHREKHASARP